MSRKWRIGLIVALVLASIYSLWPRTVRERVRNRDGSFNFVERQRVPLKYGLDLAGGVHVALEVDESKGTVRDKADALDKALKVVRTRVDQFGVAEPVVQRVGDDRIVVELPGIDDPTRAEEILQKSAFLEFQITDETNALERSLARLDAAARQLGGAATVASRAATPGAQQPSSGTAGVLGGLLGTDTTSRAGADSARDSAAVATGGPFSSVIQKGDMPGEYLVPTDEYVRIDALISRPEIQSIIPPRKVLRWSSDSVVVGGRTYRYLYVLDAEPIITGSSITDAQPQQDPIEGTLVQFQLSNEGGTQFKSQTQRNIGNYMAIVLDQRVMGRPPVIQSAISTRGQITMGRRDLQAAQDLALVLRAGALPTPLKVVEVRTIGPSLGQDAIRQGIQAGLLGLALVVLIMLVYYRFSGFLAVGGLIFYAITTLGFLAALDATLTLPGIAGFILSIGMAVDANFLQFERIREELARGKTVRTSIDEGFKHSWSAIVDTHVVTALTAAVLYQYGTGPVQGFAVTLMAGVVSSILSSVFVVRTLFLLWLDRSRGAQPLSI